MNANLDEEQLPRTFRTLGGSEDDSRGLMLKITAGVTMGLLMLGAGLWWFGSQSGAKEAALLYAKAQDACNHNRLSACLEYAERALKRHEQPEYYKLKFRALYSDGRFSESRLSLEKMLAAEPDNAHYHYLMNTVYQNEDEPDKALESLTEAIRLAPRNGDYRIAKATVLYNENRQPEAVPIYKQLITEDPKNYHYRNQYALNYSNNGHYAEALKIRQKGITQAPKDYMQHFGLASLYDEMGEKAKAVAEYRTSLELHPLENSIAAKRIYEITGKRVPAALEHLTTDSIPFVPRAKVMLVTADINGEKGTFLIDTGASLSAVFADRMSRYRLKPLYQAMSFTTANGVIQAPITYGNLRLGRHDVDSARFAVIPASSDKALDGIIGMDILENFQFEIDQPGKRIILRY